MATGFGAAGPTGLRRGLPKLVRTPQADEKDGHERSREFTPLLRTSKKNGPAGARRTAYTPSFARDIDSIDDSMESFRRSVPSDRKLRPVLNGRRMNMAGGSNDEDLPLRKEKEELLRLSAENQRLKLVIAEWLNQFAPGDGKQDQQDLLMRLLDENAHLKEAHEHDVHGSDKERHKYAEQFATQRAQVEALTNKLKEQEEQLEQLRQDIDDKDFAIREHERKEDELQALLKLEREANDEEANEEGEEMRQRLRQLEEQAQQARREAESQRDARSQLERQAQEHFERMSTEARELKTRNAELEARLQEGKENSVPHSQVAAIESDMRREFEKKVATERQVFEQTKRKLEDEARRLRETAETAQSRVHSLEADVRDREQQLQNSQKVLNTQKMVSLPLPSAVLC